MNEFRVSNIFLNYFSFLSEDELSADPKDNEQIAVEEDVVENLTTPPTTPPPTQAPKPLSRSSGNFVVLNKHNMSQFKKVKCIPAAKMRKVIFPRGNIRCFNASGRLSSIDSKPRFMTNVKMNVPKFQNFTRLSTLQQNQSQTNGDTKSGLKTELNGQASQKSGILIKRNHLKNITVRKVNVMQSNFKRGNTISINSIGSAKHNIKDNSTARAVADLDS